MNAISQKPSDLLTYADVAQRLSVGYRTVQRMVAAGQLKRVKIRGCHRILCSSVERLMVVANGDSVR